MLAEQAAIDHSQLTERDSLARIAAALRSRSSDSDPILDFYLNNKDPGVRLLAARILDLDQTPAPDDAMAKLLAPDALAFLARYLTYTRASHADLIYLVPVAGEPPPSLASLERAEEALGENLLREVISKLGWPRLNLALEVRPCTGISVARSLPLMVSEPEAAFLERCGDAHRTSSQQLVVAHGGQPGKASLAGQHGCRSRDVQGADRPEAKHSTPINRFRDYNLTHADVLVDLLDVAPLTREKVLHILGHMDKIVEDYSFLFATLSEECSILPEVYQDLKGRILTELDKAAGQPQLSIELTRLVQMFEDPGSLGAVGTLHGLKRYLHQKGLALGAKLVEAGPSDNCSVDLVLCAGGKVQSVIPKIQYSDFEPEAGERDRVRVPYSVEIVAGAFGLQALHGHKDFPLARIFCYGNEVHYYFAFRNHPAFLRIDYSPPLRGGMIDLEYFGVSKYEMSEHPNPGLDAVQAFIRRLDFEVRNDNSHIHARYDKERARDLETLCEKAEMVFRLAPYLMDLDWIIGSLELSPEARQKVTESWAESFERWGVLPLRQLLTRNRLGIVESPASGPTGESEIAWSGEGPYRDRFSTSPPTGFFSALRSALEKLSLDGVVLVASAVRPEDTIFLYRSAAVVSTGGGILSHAGLIALQFRKPALIIDGRWDREANGCPTLRYLSHEYREQEKKIAGYTVFVRRNLRDREHSLREGDPVVVDGAEGTLRVLGQDSDTLGLHEALRHFGKSSRSLSEATDEKDVLSLRGRQLRARHQIEKLPKRISDPALANHAVYELLLGESLPGDAVAEERIQLLKLLLSNPQIHHAARASLLHISVELGRRFQDACGKARKNIPFATFLWEILQLRLDVIRGHQTLAGARASLQECGIEAPRPDARFTREIERMARQRLEELFLSGMQRARASLNSEQQGIARLHHEYRGLERIADLAGSRAEDRQTMDRIRHRLSSLDGDVRRRAARRRIAGPEDCGFQLAALTGWKAANLAEMERLAGTGFVPQWSQPRL